MPNILKFILVFLLIAGCSYKPIITSSCLDRAIDSADTWRHQTGWKTRLVYGKIADSEKFHIQAQAYHPGENRWIWIERIPRIVEYYIGDQDKFEPEKILTSEEARKKWIN